MDKPSVHRRPAPGLGAADLSRLAGQVIAAMCKHVSKPTGAPVPDGRKADRKRGLAMPWRSF